MVSPERALALRKTIDPALAQQVVAQAAGARTRQPHYLPAVHTAGLLDGEGVRDASIQAQEDWRQLRLQALAFRLSGDAAHLACAQRYVAAWAGSYQPGFGPIDETELAAVLCGIDLVQDRLPAAQMALARLWCQQVARGYLAKKIVSGGASTGVNNWHSHRIKIGTGAAFLSGDAALIAAAREEFALQVMRNIDSGGKVVDFEQRDALHYVPYSLEPLLMAASMAAAHGEDWYGAPATSGRLGKALDWLRPYAMGEKGHEEFVHSSVAFDKRRADAGVKGYAGPWRRNESATLYWLASRFDRRYDAVSASLAPAPPWVQALFAQRYA